MALNVRCGCGSTDVVCECEFVFWDLGELSWHFVAMFSHFCPICDHTQNEITQGRFCHCPFCKRDGSHGTRVIPVWEQPTVRDKCDLLVVDFKEISRELIEYFGKHPDELTRLNWRKFEQLLAAVFKNQGFYTELGPGTGDGGVDIRLIQKDSIGQLVTLVQAKRYSSDNPIKLDIVAALTAIVDDQKAHRGLLVTTSRYLPSAQHFAESQRGRIVLATSADVAAWCRRIAR